MKRNAAKLPVGHSYGSAISSASLPSLRLHHAVHFHPKCQTNLPEGRRRRGWFLSVAAGMSAYVHILPYCMFNHINCILNLNQYLQYYLTHMLIFAAVISFPLYDIYQYDVTVFCQIITLCPIYAQCKITSHHMIKICHMCCNTVKWNIS